jgi:RNA polymerase sigma-70 factor (ECF subfamily)
MTSGSERTDQDLLRAYAESRDGESLGVFFGRYQDSLIRFMTKLLQDREAAQDIVQETFLRVAREPRRLFDVTNCHNWLLTVARNLGISHLRHRIRVRKHHEVLRVRLAANVAAGEEAKPAIEEEEVRQKVRAEIGRLSGRHREVLLLKVQEDKSYREIAEITGLSITNVGYILHQAMKDLSRKLNHSREDLV